MIDMMNKVDKASTQSESVRPNAGMLLVTRCQCSIYARERKEANQEIYADSRHNERPEALAAANVILTKKLCDHWTRRSRFLAIGKHPFHPGVF